MFIATFIVIEIMILIYILDTVLTYYLRLKRLYQKATINLSQRMERIQLKIFLQTGKTLIKTHIDSKGFG